MGFFSKLFGKTEETIDPNQIYAPMAGRTVPVTEVPDPTFAEGLLGDGIAIIPTDGKVYAPCNATVGTMFDTGHAISLEADSGAEILIHVGLETVGLGGKCFRTHVVDGQKVKKGQLLFEADLEGIKAAGLPVITPVLVCNSDEFVPTEKVEGNEVAVGDRIITIAK
jgi:PTS system beta-glucosides-specific IIC component